MPESGREASARLKDGSTGNTEGVARDKRTNHPEEHGVSFRERQEL